MLENSIIYTLEVIKYYLIMKYLLGFKVRRNALLSLVGAGVILLFSAYVTVTEDNPIALFLVYIFVEIFILIKGKKINIVFVTGWLMIIVGMLDSLFLVIVEMAAYKVISDGLVLHCIGSIMTAVFLVVLVYIVNKKTHGEKFEISKTYYIYFTLLTGAEGILVTMLKMILGNDNGVKGLTLIFICSIIMMLNIIIVLCLAVSNDGYKERDRINKMHLKTQEEYYLYLKDKNEDIRKFKHDMQGHLITMHQLMAKGDVSNVEKYLEKIAENIHSDKKEITVNNGVVDAIIHQNLYESKKQNIAFNVEGQLFEECGIEPYDLCVIFANVLKNAVEASGKCNEKYIDMKINRTKENIEIYVENSCNDEVIIEEGEYVTTKEDNNNHGYGLKNVYASVEKYNGVVTIGNEEGKFYINIFIPLMN
ncbi:MAG: GHKL domain-containing protein [Lachnospiraceae bacterium]|nr:GHKL domain-containing protein [Lachnospiraceae bacterium]